MTAEHLPGLTRAILEQTFGDDQRDRTLVIVSLAGLCNRIRALISGLAVAEAAGRAFAMLWPPNRACGARFDELFQNRWRVVDCPIRPADMRLVRASTWSDKHLQRLLADKRQHIVLGHCNWLVAVKSSSSRSSLQQRCLQLVSELELTAPLATRIETFRTEHFPPTMIGVHLRRGDAIRLRPQSSSNTSAALRAVDRFVDHDAQAGILLCADDGAPDPFISPADADRGDPGQIRRALRGARGLDHLDPCRVRQRALRLGDGGRGWSVRFVGPAWEGGERSGVEGGEEEGAGDEAQAVLAANGGGGSWGNAGPGRPGRGGCGDA